MKVEPPTTSGSEDGPGRQQQPRQTGLRSTKPRGSGLQFSLLTFFLVIALFAISLVCWQAGMSIERVEHQLVGLRSVARELEIDDPAQFAVVAKIGKWYGEEILEIYVPAGQSYQLCLALDAIGKDGCPDPQRVASLPTGVHRIEIIHDSNGDEASIEILVDGRVVIAESRPKAWETRAGSCGGTAFTHSTQCPADETLVLFRQRFMVRSATGSIDVPKNPSAGILVWVGSEETE